ncbi:YqiA/YcfP family alpha/beta fold hydrolase [Sulfurimonas sp.]|uniref:YqiA/YcfP family alpha/beta fold hydrolase n=1 Tax=Sulfurimonas sp. TaxID=2022749 RepID=UPI0025D6FC58|nr:YqiA/YcfP family alpha/beta fold hydrolase [Sulfurimonas sp.]
MIIYIHGFSGSGEGSKARAFRKYFKNKGDNFIVPSLSYIPDLAIKTLEELIESYDGDVELIGSSLGGFYTLYLADKYKLKAVLINPSIYPYITLDKLLGNAPSFYDDSSFTWMESHLEMLKKYETKVQSQSDFMLLVQKGDELLDYEEAVNKLPDARVIAEEDGNHGFEGIERHFTEVRMFFGL